jgi:anti-sigma regulatory factor (Ser/Thr protein kinase)
MERCFPRDLGALESIHVFVVDFLSTNGIPAANAFEVDLILEELFTNMVKHSKDGRHDIAVGLSRDGEKLTIRIRDFDVEAYDLTQAPEFDESMPMSERRGGGMGLHLVRRIAESLQYEYIDRNSIITVTKRIQP